MALWPQTLPASKGSVGVCVGQLSCRNIQFYKSSEPPARWRPNKFDTCFCLFRYNSWTSSNNYHLAICTWMYYVLISRCNNFLTSSSLSSTGNMTQLAMKHAVNFPWMCFRQEQQFWFISHPRQVGAKTAAQDEDKMAGDVWDYSVWPCFHLLAFLCPSPRVEGSKPRQAQSACKVIKSL